MGLQHSGSNLLTVYTDYFNLEISDCARKNDTCNYGPGESRIKTKGLNSLISIRGQNPIECGKECCIPVSPMFFEQKDYTIVLRPKTEKDFTIDCENEPITSKFNKIMDTNILYGIVNHGSSIGYTRYSINVDSSRRFRWPFVHL